MPNLSKQKLTIFLLATIFLIIIGIKIFIVYRQRAGDDTLPAKVKGNPKAEIKIVEYLDYRCGACGRGSQILDEMLIKYPDQMLIEMRFFPLNIMQYDALSARYAECAAQQGKFWEYHDLLFQKQNQWRKLTSPQAAFEVLAKDLQMDLEELKICVKDDNIKKYVTDSKRQGEFLGVKNTPTYFVNGKMYVGVKSLNKELTRLLESGKRNDE